MGQLSHRRGCNNAIKTESLPLLVSSSFIPPVSCNASLCAVGLATGLGGGSRRGMSATLPAGKTGATKTGASQFGSASRTTAAARGTARTGRGKAAAPAASADKDFYASMRAEIGDDGDDDDVRSFFKQTVLHMHTCVHRHTDTDRHRQTQTQTHAHTRRHRHIQTHTQTQTNGCNVSPSHHTQHHSQLLLLVIQWDEDSDEDLMKDVDAGQLADDLGVWEILPNCVQLPMVLCLLSSKVRHPPLLTYEPVSVFIGLFSLQGPG